MSQQIHLIQLEPNEDAISVRDRLSFFRGTRVALVWPEQGSVLQRKLDLVLVQREAMRRAIQLALVTHDAHVVKNATELNISTFDTIDASERGRWKRGRTKVFANRHQRPQDEPDPEDLMDVASRVRQERQTSWWQRALGRGVVLILLLSTLVGTFVFIYPSATVVIQPQKTIVETTVAVIASPEVNEVDFEQGIVPVTRLRVEMTETGTTETSGSQALTASRAGGTVVFINRGSASVDVPVGTSVSTSASTPVLFRTLEDITVPAGEGAQAEIGVEALQASAGQIGNVNAGQINTVLGPLADRVDVRNTAPTSGGDSRTVPAVTEADQDRLEAIVRQQIQAQAFEEMEPLLGESQFIILESIYIAEEREDWKTFSGGPGEIADTLTLSMRAVVEAFAVNEQFGTELAFAALGAEIPRGQEIQSGTLTYTRSGVLSAIPGERVVYPITAQASIAEPVSEAALQRRLSGMPIEDALAYINAEIDLADNTTPSIDVLPDWFGRMPFLPIRIQVRLIEDPTT